eukprot:gene19211-38460_t
MKHGLDVIGLHCLEALRPDFAAGVRPGDVLGTVTLSGPLPAQGGSLLELTQGGKVALVYLESPANPTNALVDVEAVRASRDAAFPGEQKPAIAIDNTFLGPLWQQPIKQGAELVVYSLTKYAGGHSDLVAGGVSGNQALINIIRPMRNVIGTICDPNTAWMLLRSLETLELRMTRAGENAAKVCAFLKAHPKVEGLGYLGMIDDPRQQDIYNRHCSGAGSTFSLFIRGGEAESFRFLDALKIAKLAVSLGGTETLASHPAAMTHLSVPQERKDALGITDNLVRISIGIEDPDDLIADFDQALALRAVGVGGEGFVGEAEQRRVGDMVGIGADVTVF